MVSAFLLYIIPSLVWFLGNVGTYFEPEAYYF
jgi:hypothetical protein